MLTFLNFFYIESILRCIQTQGFKINIKPVECLSFYLFIMHTKINLPIVGSRKVNHKTAVFFFEQLTQVARIHQYTSTWIEQLLHT